ncbi:MAG: TlyA family RNA methyltransferase [Clostridia bacterium]|nr:TlyA family RNA methyltransferase [Clostridia bacterium]
MNRLDKEIVECNLAPTRAKAQELIKGGNIKVNGKIITKTSFDISPTDIIEIIDNSALKYVSRAGLKLEKAINTFNLDFNEKNIMDIGSSTGGFTDCSLQNGAKKIIAVDVGTNLMHENLRNHPQVELHEQTNIKDLPNDKFKGIDYITIDVSFVSLNKIIDKIYLSNCNADIIALIKPQFECGKAIADKFKGIILNQKIHHDILSATINMLKDFGYTLLDLTFSPITGGDGNIEYISHFTKSPTTKPKTINLKQLISNAFEAHKK